MKFGDKIRKLRKEKDLTQAELGATVGVSMRTIMAYENDQSHPKKRAIYGILADYFGVDVNYLLTEDETFIAEASEKYGSRGAKQARELVAEVGGMFAGGELSEADKDAVMRALQEAYWDAKIENKKYTPKIYL